MLLHDERTGTGALEYSDGTRIACAFTLQQFYDGALFLTCTLNNPLDRIKLFIRMHQPPARVAGQTNDGLPVTTKGNLLLTELNDSVCTLRAPCVSIGTSNEGTHAFLLTNLVLPTLDSNTMPASVNLTIPTTPPTIVRITANRDYVARARLQRRHKHAIPTAYLTIPITSSETASEVANALCIALSVVQGHKINWITHTTTDASAATLSESFHDRVTKRSSSLALNRKHNKDERLPLAAAQDAYHHVIERQARYDWNGRVLETWLEARTDNDYLETRALKMVTVIEALRAIVLKDQPPRQHLAQAAWDEFLAYILPAARFFLTAGLKQAKQPVEALTTRTRWEALNRTSFRTDITATLKHLGAKENGRTIDLFVQSRNKLIHEGRFRCGANSPAVAREPDAPQSPWDEYEFIASFVDRVILQCFGLHHHVTPPPAAPIGQTQLPHG